MLFLTQEDVLQAGGDDITMFVETVEEAFRLKEAGSVASPRKIELRWPGIDAPVEEAGRAMAMPGYVGGRFDVAGIKWIPSVPSNPRLRGLPRANAVILLSSRETGLPVAVMDGTIISAMRTAAVTGLVLRHCAMPESRTVALLGAGPIAKTHLLALRNEAPRAEVLWICDPDKDRASQLAREASDDGWSAYVTADSAEATNEADIVIAATTARESSFDPRDLRPGTTVCLVSRLDAPTTLHRRTDCLVVDDWHHETEHNGRYVNRLLQAGLVEGPADVIELGALISGAAQARHRDDEIVVASTVGLGIEDIASAKTILDRATLLEIGEDLPFRRGAPTWV